MGTLERSKWEEVPVKFCERQLEGCRMQTRIHREGLFVVAGFMFKVKLHDITVLQMNLFAMISGVSNLRIK